MIKNYKLQDDLLVFMMPAELDQHVAGEIAGEIDSLIDIHSIRRLILDFSQTCFMDSAGIGTVIGRCKKLKYVNGKVKIVNMNDRVERLFKAAGLHRIIDFGKEKSYV